MNKEQIKSFYNSNEWIRTKINEFIYGNKRIDECLEFLERHANMKKYSSICEIGCSIGLTSYEIHLRYPSMDIDGYDIACDQIEFANKLFSNEKLKFFCQNLSEKPNEKKYDIITLFDVFEHIPKYDRPSFIQNIKGLLREDSLIFITTPSYIKSRFDIIHRPDLLQVVDEVITPNELFEFAELVEGSLIYCELKSVWNQFDYCHSIISKANQLEKIEAIYQPTLFGKLLNKLGFSYRQRTIRERTNLIKKKLAGHYLELDL